MNSIKIFLRTDHVYRYENAKTAVDVSIPINHKALGLIPEKITEQEKVFRGLSNQKTNEHLKDIIKIAGIEKSITFHSARHTLATNGLELGIPLEVVSKIFGHTEIKTTQIYAKVNDNLKYREMQKM
jgi:integrase/recombinase XerC